MVKFFSSEVRAREAAKAKELAEGAGTTAPQPPQPQMSLPSFELHPKSDNGEAFSGHTNESPSSKKGEAAESKPLPRKDIFSVLAARTDCRVVFPTSQSTPASSSTTSAPAPFDFAAACSKIVPKASTTNQATGWPAPAPAPIPAPAPAPIPTFTIPTYAPVTIPAQQVFTASQYQPSAVQIPNSVACFPTINPNIPYHYQPSWQNGLNSLLALTNSNGDSWATLVGLYFQESGRSPAQVAHGKYTGLLEMGWRVDIGRVDLYERIPDAEQDKWRLYDNDLLVMNLSTDISSDTSGFKASVFEEAVRQWASDARNQGLVAAILQKAGWTQQMLYGSPKWWQMDEVLKMEDGEEKKELLARAKKFSPRLYEACMNDPFCGMRRIVKRKRDEWSDEEYVVTSHRIIGTETREEYPDSPPPPKTFIMSAEYGRPTQFHNVPIEERAIDSKGNRLPWSLEWPEDHPNARHQKRHPEEKGPFGKSNIRKGTSRTRTATPAKKENPTIDGFERALNYDLKKKAEDTPNATRIQNESNITSHQAPSMNKEPTQLMIFGYSTSTQWAAIDLYEKNSGGIICEDYERQPPAELRKYPNTFSNSPRTRSRPLTQTEKAMAFKYAGGNNWVKITFDSAEAAERALEHSPIRVYGHWVYAQLYHGSGPELDEPILMQEGEREAGRPLHKPFHTLGAAYAQRAGIQQRGAATTLPRSFSINPNSQPQTHQQNETGSPPSSTASSGTATGLENANIRHRDQLQAGAVRPAQVQQRNPQMMRHFPDTPRYVLRPASEAFLPQPSWWDRQLQWLAAQGLVPGEIIGNGVPLLDNGEFDWARASFYWKICYWIDSHLGTDLCGLKDND